MALKIVWMLLHLCSALLPASAGEINTYHSVPDVEKAMYTVLGGYPCVRLLNTSGEIGCSNPGDSKVVAPIISFRSTIFFLERYTVLLSLGELCSFLTRVSEDPVYARHVSGVLVESVTGTHKLSDFSPDGKFPQSWFSPYANMNYSWNPSGSSIMWNRYDFPIFLLSEYATSIAQKAAFMNEEISKTSSKHVAEFDQIMQTTKSRTRNSESCLNEGTCLPLGGYSVWTSLPPMNFSSLESTMPIILVVASMDSASFFRGRSVGADSPISGLISLLAAVDVLSNVASFNKRLVFMVFTGEAWGYLGSRRFLLELDQHADSVKGLSAPIEMVFEIGSVGKAEGPLVVHPASNSGATQVILTALRNASDSLTPQGINVSMASASNPGVPPSSLMAFLRKNPGIGGVVLEDFDTSFSNDFYHGDLDDMSNINSTAVTGAATLAARALYMLTSFDEETSAATLSEINANLSLVEELMGCLLSCDPGLSCSLVSRYISPRRVCPENYVGVVFGKPSPTPPPHYVADVPRFLFNFLADLTASARPQNLSCPQPCAAAGGVCIGSEANGPGSCVLSTSRYVPAYSTRLKYEAGGWGMLAVSNDDVDSSCPVWTESYWDSIGLRIYRAQDEAYDVLTLLAGVVVTAASFLAISLSKLVISNAMRQE